MQKPYLPKDEQLEVFVQVRIFRPINIFHIRFGNLERKKAISIFARPIPCRNVPVFSINIDLAFEVWMFLAFLYIGKERTAICVVVL